METTTDPTVIRLAKRTELFKRRGLDEKRALDVAETLRRRDGDFDDRRMCIECAHLQRDGGCFAARQAWIHGAATYLTPAQTMLQRCGHFEWQIP